MYLLTSLARPLMKQSPKRLCSDGHGRQHSDMWLTCRTLTLPASRSRVQ